MNKGINLVVAKETANENTAMLLKKVYCECGQEMKYWLCEKEETAYGICDMCHLSAPTEIEWTETVEDDQRCTK